MAFTVNGGYTPDVIEVETSQPVRVRLNYQESASSSERAIFPDFNQNAF